MLIYKVVEAFEKEKVEYAIVGGFAVALHGALRGTIDLDIILTISEKNFLAAERALLKVGFQSRLPVKATEVFRFRKEYIENRNLIAWNFYNPNDPIELVDLIITHDLSKLKTVTILTQRHRLKVLAIKDLIRMKQQSGRPQDIEDIKALEKLLK